MNEQSFGKPSPERFVEHNCTERRLAEDLPCVNCGYNLRTLSLMGVCPECGIAVARSIEYRNWFRPLTPWETRKRMVLYLFANLAAFFAPSILLAAIATSGHPARQLGFALLGPTLFLQTLVGCVCSPPEPLMDLASVGLSAMIVGGMTWYCAKRAKHPRRIPLLLLLISLVQVLLLFGLAMVLGRR
jgi:hypothetical protein